MGTLVYKYLPPERIDVIDSLSIRITQPVSLNDPFEYFNLFDFSEFETKNPQNNEILAYTNDQITEELHKSINKSINEKFGVVSFSKNELSNLLWAHYAKNSTGYVIGFNPSDKMFSTKIKNLKSAFNEVKYSETRPKFKIEDLRIDHCRGSSYSPGRVMVIPRGYIICYSTVSKSRQAACSATARFRMPSLR